MKSIHTLSPFQLKALCRFTAVLAGSFLMLMFARAASADQLFSDVPDNHPYSEAIKYLSEQGIVNGYPDGTFRPDDTINRAEFVKILVGVNSDTKDFTDCNTLDFSDTDSAEWYVPFLCHAKSEGIINGYPDGTFKPTQNINFAEAAKIITLGFKYDIKEDSELWFKSYVEDLSNRKSIPISIKGFDYRISRGEMADIIFSLRSSSKKQYLKLTVKESSYALMPCNTEVIEPYKCDAGEIYFGSNIVSNADPLTFRVFEAECQEYDYHIQCNYYAIDNERAYYQGKFIENADPHSFQLDIFNKFYASDDIYFYYKGNIISQVENYENFIAFNEIYAKDKNNVYFLSDKNEPEVVKDADPETFNVKNIYGIDKNYAYCDDQPIEGSDGQSFQVAGMCDCLSGNCSLAYDKNNVYYHCEKVPDIDIDSFIYPGYDQDLCEFGYFMDQDTVYFYDIKIANADAESFEVFLDYFDYAKDKNNLYYRGNILEGFDLGSFEVIDSYYSKDKNNVYYQNNIIIEADSDTFEVTDFLKAKDKNYEYYQGKIIEK